MTNNEILSLNEELDYTHGFEADKIKFLAGDMFQITGISKKWITFTNFHGNVELNATPNYISGKRTLIWANPFEYSRYLFSTLSDAHNYSALLLDWVTKSGVNTDEHHYYRDQVTFMIVPPNKEMNFLIGFAAPQENKDKRTGGGIQLRFKKIPSETIIITSPLQLKKSETKEGDKGSKMYDFEKAYENAMADLENYVDNLPISNRNEVSIPQNIFMQKHKIYSTEFDDYDFENLEKDQINYINEIIKKFDVLKYVTDQWRVTHMEEVLI